MGLGDINVHLIDSSDELTECLQWFEKNRNNAIAVDTESEGLRVHKDKVRLIQVGDEHTAWVFPAEGGRSWAGLAIDLLEKHEGQYILHNSKFDVRALRQSNGLNLPLDRVHDTMLMARVAEPTKSAALKRLASILVDPRAAMLQVELDNAMKSAGFTWADVPLTFQTYWLYGGIDTCLTKSVFNELVPKIQAHTQAYGLELAVAATAGRMEDYGAHIDTKLAEQKHGELLKYVDDIIPYCKNTWGVHPGKNAEIIAFLQKEGFEFTTMTKGGSISLDATVLTSITHPLAEMVLGRRKAQKIASTYLKHFYEDPDSDDIIHPSINTCAAATSRMSMSDPNLQNLPRKSESNPLAELVRSCVTAREGNTLVMADFDQIEWRLFASLSEDERLIHAFDEGDFFTNIAREIYNDLDFEKSDPRRQIVKNAMYAKIYGAGVEKFAWTAGIGLNDAEQFMGILDNRLPAIRHLQQKIMRQGETNLYDYGTAWVDGVFTDRIHVIDDDKSYKLVNYKIQGAAADILKMKIIQLDQAGLGPFMVAPVHDEIILDIPRDRVHDAVATIKDTMNDKSLTAVPITSSVSVGERWSEKKEYDPTIQY